MAVLSTLLSGVFSRTIGGVLLVALPVAALALGILAPHLVVKALGRENPEALLKELLSEEEASSEGSRKRGPSQRAAAARLRDRPAAAPAAEAPAVSDDGAAQAVPSEGDDEGDHLLALAAAHLARNAAPKTSRAEAQKKAEAAERGAQVNGEQQPILSPVMATITTSSETVTLSVKAQPASPVRSSDSLEGWSKVPTRDEEVIASLKARLATITKEGEARAAQVEAAQSEAKRAADAERDGRERARALQSHLLEVERENASIKAANALLTAKVEGLQSAISREPSPDVLVNAQLASERLEVIALLEARLVAAADGQEHLQVSLDEARATLTTLGATVTALEEANATLRADFERITAEAEEANAAAAAENRTERESLVEAAEEARSQLETLTGQVATLTAALEEANGATAEAAKASTATADGLLERVAALTCQLEEAFAASKKFEEETDALRDELLTTRATIASNEAAIASSKATIASNEATIASNEATIASKEATIASNEATIAAHEATIAESETIIAAQKATIAENEAAIASTKEGAECVVRELSEKYAQQQRDHAAEVAVLKEAVALKEAEALKEVAARKEVEALREVEARKEVEALREVEALKEAAARREEPAGSAATEEQVRDLLEQVQRLTRRNEVIAKVSEVKVASYKADVAALTEAHERAKEALTTQQATIERLTREAQATLHASQGLVAESSSAAL